MSGGVGRRDVLRAGIVAGAGALGASAGARQVGSGSSPVPPAGGGARASDAREACRAFLRSYERGMQPLYARASEAQWLASTDVSEAHTAAAIAAQKPLNEFVGERSRLEALLGFRRDAWRLEPLQVRQLDAAFFRAAQYPGTLPELVARRTEAEARQTAAQDGFRFSLVRDGAPVTVTANDLDDVLTGSRDIAERRAAWESSKAIGGVLRDGLLDLRALRNECAQELGFSSYFGLMVAEYGMTPAELVSLGRTVLAQTRPLYEQLHCFARHELAARYGQPVPRRLPAHWLPNRWGQQWPGLVGAANLDPLMRARDPRWMVEQSERFYVSMGFPPLPRTFWERSDLWDLPADAGRKKNTHASAWHIDLADDVRSLMSVKPTSDWFTTTHHELGHIYYYMAYTGAGVPLLLREGANRAFHEGIGELISLACLQRPYLAEIGVLDAAAAADAEQNAGSWLLSQALDGSNIVFQPWSWGVMTGWEHDFYESALPPAQLNERWWRLVAEHQGIEPPAARPDDLCDPATKTHINDDPAGYYDYAISSLIVYQLHDYIARHILRQDPHNCSYYGRKDVGEYLMALLSLGATRDWREVLRTFTGEDLSARAMLAYYEPLWPVLREANKGRDVSFA